MSEETLKNIQNDEEDVLSNEGDRESSSSDEDEDDDSQDNINNDSRYWPPPLENDLNLEVSTGKKTISALSFNQEGSRIATGGHDFNVSLWDFASMSHAMPNALCCVQPCGHHIIKNIDYNEEDSLVLVVSGSCQAKVLSKEGLASDKLECAKGDQYISDMANTTGHTLMLNDGCWNQRSKNEFITCSNDGTIRIWDTTSLVKHKHIIKPRSPSSGLKAIPNICRFSKDCLMIVGACNDGSILMWDTRRKFINTSACIKNAHFKGTETSGLDFAYTYGKICSRGGDDTCKVWDLRQLKSCLKETRDLLNRYPLTDCLYSPDDKTILTSVSCDRQQPGQLLFLDSESMEVKEVVKEAQDVSIIRCKWHPKINQIAYSCSNGAVKLYYSSRTSIGGARLCEVKSARKKYKSRNSIDTGQILTPHALPMFKEDSVRSSKNMMMKARLDPVRSHKPELPVSGPGQGGRLAASGSTLSSYIAKNIAKRKGDDSVDVRQSILRHAEDAEKKPYWFTPAYAKTQPHPVFREEDDEDKDGPATKKKAV